MQVQKPSTDEIREFVIAGHGDLTRVREMITTKPELLDSSYQWKDDDKETAIQAAAQVGNAPIAEFLLAQGAPLETCTAAMLGRDAEVRRRLDVNPQEALAVGAHGIPLLPHVVWSGNLELVQFLYKRGATAGANLALHNAVLKGDPAIIRWLLENARPDMNFGNYQGKTPLTVAKERGLDEIVQLLQEYIRTGFG